MPNDEIAHILEYLRCLEEKIDKLVSKEVLDLIIQNYESRITRLEEWKAGIRKTALSLAGAIVGLILGILALLSYIKLPHNP